MQHQIQCSDYYYLLHVSKQAIRRQYSCLTGHSTVILILLLTAFPQIHKCRIIITPESFNHIFIESTTSATLNSYVIKIRNTIDIFITKTTLVPVTMSIFIITAKGLVMFIRAPTTNKLLWTNWIHCNPYQINVLRRRLLMMFQM